MHGWQRLAIMPDNRASGMSPPTDKNKMRALMPDRTVGV